MKKYLKNLSTPLKDKPTQWLSVVLCGSLCHKKKILISLSLFLFFIWGISLSSQTLDDYLKIAAENNPGLKSKYFSYQASLEKAPQVGGLPDPELSFGYFIKPMERYVGNQVAEISIMQMFPWFGTLGYAEDEATLKAKARFEEFNDTKSKLFYEVKKAWYELYFLESEIKITQENLDILSSLEELTTNRLSSGESKQSNMMNSMGSGGTSMINVLRVQMEINELKNNLALLKDKRKPLAAQFNSLLNRSDDEPINIPLSIETLDLPLSISELPDSIKQRNPLIRMLQKEEDALLAQEERNIRNSYPKIGLGLKYSIFESRAGVQSMMNGNNMIMPMATISIPIWRGKYNASIEEARLQQQKVFNIREETKNKLLVEYEETLKDFKDAARRKELYSDQTKLAEQTLDLLITQYSTTGSQFEEVLKMQQQLLDFGLKRLNARVDQNLSVAMLERLLGR